MKTDTDYSYDALLNELSGFVKTKSPLFPEFSFDRLRDDLIAVKTVKEGNRRTVFYLQTPEQGFFLKYSPVVNKKDRYRHLFFLRRWAEWRNLHKLLARDIETALPVLKGAKPGILSDAFFMLTQEVGGASLAYDSDSQAETLGRYMALLHHKGIFHADLHPGNLIIQKIGRPCLIDVQEVFFPPLLPHRLRVYNLGLLFFSVRPQLQSKTWTASFLRGYNKTTKKQVTAEALHHAADRHLQRHFRSRGKRCCKNSTEFVPVKEFAFTGYRRRSFHWGRQELQEALEKGTTAKKDRVVHFQGVTVKIHPKRRLHQDRCLVAWKMSRALEVRGIAVPRALGYFAMKGHSYFLSEFIVDSMVLNAYLSSFSAEPPKRRAIKKLALWLKRIHDHHIWQHDFKSDNVLCQNGDYLMTDLDKVKIRSHLPEKKKIVNLAQLNASLSNAVTIKDRMRFYYHYSADKKPSRQARRDVYKKVCEITTTKTTVLYGLDTDKLMETLRSK